MKIIAKIKSLFRTKSIPTDRFGCYCCRQVKTNYHSTPYCPCSEEKVRAYYNEMLARFSAAAIPEEIKGKREVVRFMTGHGVDGCRGLFPLCEQCWLTLTPEQRLPFYRELLDLWESLGINDMQAIRAEVEANVLAGL